MCVASRILARGDDRSGMVTGKKLGFWAFLFFLGKGLLWLTIPAVFYFRAC